MKSFILFTVLTSQVALAQGYRCNVQGNPDYSVEVNVQGKKAAFNDNNEWTVVSQKRGPSLDGILRFSGKDSFGDPVAVTFDTTESAYLTGIYGSVTFTGSEKALTKKLVKCRVVRTFNSGI